MKSYSKKEIKKWIKERIKMLKSFSKNRQFIEEISYRIDTKEYDIFIHALNTKTP